MAPTVHCAVIQQGLEIYLDRYTTPHVSAETAYQACVFDTTSVPQYDFKDFALNRSKKSVDVGYFEQFPQNGSPEKFKESFAQRR